MESLRCTNCASYIHSEEDNTLQVAVETSYKCIYALKENGTLNFIDTNGEDQEIYLECPICGQRYEFTYSQGIVMEEVPTIRLMNYRGDLYPINSIEDLAFRKVGK